MESLDETITFSTPVIIAGAGLATLWGQWFVGCGVQPSFFLMLLIVFSSSIVGGDGITYGFVSAVSSAIMIEKGILPPTCPLGLHNGKIALGYFAVAVLSGSYAWTGYVLAVLVAYRTLVLAITLKASFPLVFLFEIVWRFMPKYSYTEEQFFRTDAPTEETAKKREAAFNKFKLAWAKKWSKSAEYAKFFAAHFSDLRFAANNRVFFPYSQVLQDSFEPTTVVTKTDRMDLIDIDGQVMTDISGSYGVNVCGYDAYKKFLTEGMEMVKDLGCVLGSLHPITMENIKMLSEVSGHPEISFHMSGTEAVMCAVRVARFNTQKKLIVVFGGAYHGWWDGVQTTAGNPRIAYDVLTFKDMDPTVLTVLALRASEIACVIVNPLQSFHVNKPPPSDLVLASNTRGAGEAPGYGKWLQDLAGACHRSGIVFILDEVYTGFRLAPGGAQEYFNVKADIVCYGKTLGGGMPMGVVCGPKCLMARSDALKPLRVAYVVGTFAAHPLAMASMNCFLKWSTSEKGHKEHAALTDRVNAWVIKCNARMTKEDLPLQVANYQSVWTMLYQCPGRYHWFLQYYLRDEGIALSWVGTGRLNYSMDFMDKDLDEVTEKMVRACRRMKDDGWWDVNPNAGKLAIPLKMATEVITAAFANIPKRIAAQSNKMYEFLQGGGNTRTEQKGGSKKGR